MSTTPAPRAAAIYLRRSSRKDSASTDKGAAHPQGSNRSLYEQEAECRALAERVGLNVVEVYREREGTGASARSRKARPEWARALADLDRGDRFETVIVWALDRADRRGADRLAEILTLHAATGRRILGVDGTDTSDERQRLANIVRAEIARDEAEKIAARVSRTKRTRREDGRWLGGPAPYGLINTPDGRLAPHPETFDTARGIAEDLLAGSTLAAVVKRLNAESTPAPRGERWRIGSLSALVRSPGWSGLQSIRRRLPSGDWAAVADVYTSTETGQPVSVGVGVISPAERERILDALAERTKDASGTRRDGEHRRTGRRPSPSLLVDLLRCPACGSRPARTGAAGRQSYRCANAAQGAGRCPGFTAPADALDDYVGRAFRQRLAALDPGDALLYVVADAWTARRDPVSREARAEAEDAVALAREALSRLQRLAVSGVLDEVEAARQAPALRRRVREAEARLAALPSPVGDLSVLLDLVLTEEAWDVLPVAERRALLALAVDEVRVSRARGRGYRFDPAERVVIVWRAVEAEARPVVPLRVSDAA